MERRLGGWGGGTHKGTGDVTTTPCALRVWWAEGKRISCELCEGSGVLLMPEQLLLGLSEGMDLSSRAG